MNRKMFIAMAFVVLFLMGSLIVIVSGNTNSIDTSSNAPDDTCVGDCNNCDDKCKNSEECSSQGDGICEKTGSCSQNRQMTKNCNSDCDGSSSCSQNTLRIRRCNSGSSCSGSCIN